MRLDPDLIGGLDLAGALTAASKRPGDFFPSRLGFAAATRSKTFVPILAAELKRGYEPSAPESVQVPKWSGGTRPATDLAIKDRLVMDALVARTKSLVVPGLVNWSPRGQDRRDAEVALVSGKPKYVFMTDVAAFYEYVDHEILADELLDLTGDESGSTSLVAVLGALTLGRRGLPQGPMSAGDLADVYLSIADRRMVRDGFTVYRFTDDYRIPVAAWGDARRAQVSVERYLREVGLVLNIGKTFSPKLERYRQWEEESRPAWLVEMVEPGETVEDDSDGLDENDEDLFASEYDEPDYEVPEGVDTRKLRRQVEAALGREIETAAFWGTQVNVRQSKRIRPAIAVLSSLGSPRILDSLSPLLANYPHLAREVSLALRDLVVGEHSAAVLDALSGVLLDGKTLFEWQTGWLLHAMVPATEHLPKKLMDKVMGEFGRESAPWFVRARAAAVLSTEGALPLGAEFQHMLDECPAATLPDLIAAAHNMPGGKGDRIVKSAKDPIAQGIPAAVDELGALWL